MAFRPGLKVANLTEAQVQTIKDAEEELGVVLIVYDE